MELALKGPCKSLLYLKVLSDQHDLRGTKKNSRGAKKHPANIEKRSTGSNTPNEKQLQKTCFRHIIERPITISDEDSISQDEDEYQYCKDILF